jgi:hypothetical protein
MIIENIVYYIDRQKISHIYFRTFEIYIFFQESFQWGKN